ncbi:MAG: penicillin-binding protein 1B [Porticoccaceae bacterium]
MAQRKAGRRTSRRWNKKTSKAAIWTIAGIAVAALLVVSVIAGLVLDRLVRNKFAGAKWALPAHVFSRALELYEGLPLGRDGLVWELDRLGYRRGEVVQSPGQYRLAGNQVELYSRAFRFWDEDKSAQQLTASFAGRGIASLRDSAGRPLPLARLEPLMIGGIYPEKAEDRVPVRLEELPPYLADALVAVEDRDFYSHSGVSPKSILRALVSNVQAGKIAQGGSTITQQLVKNFYLNQDRSLMRKMLEATMAMLLELHYSKVEILEAYVNEIYFGQAGKRAIHGFGMASLHYFRQPINELDIHQVALLVAMAKGASWYDPVRNPQRALTRRNLVIDVMVAQGLVEGRLAASAKQRPLDISPGTTSVANPFPAYLELVKRQLRQDYRESDLNAGGLRIFTHFDPQAQRQLEDGIAKGLRALEASHGIKAGALEAASTVVRVGTGEVLAIAGGRRPGFAGFNRALDARRPVGSTLKPAVYLTALQQPGRYTLATLISDDPISMPGGNGDTWEPENFDHLSHGEVPLYKALGFSYNQATVRLGMALGLPTVIDTIRRLGYQQELPEVPALLLGSVGMTSFDVAEIYHTIAAEGFYTPLRSISAVYTADNQPVKRYPLAGEQRFAPESMHLLRYALQVVVREGTGRGVSQYLPESLSVAGKTGTSNDQRDSWFSGFSGNYLTVVWVGKDNNEKTPLTGGSGAVQIWGRIMAGLDNQSLPFTQPDSIVDTWINPATGQLSAAHCVGARRVPFVAGSEPVGLGGCDIIPVQPLFDWLKEIFN